MALEEDYEYNCPYCMSPISVRIDVTGGSRQHFVIDCENCCRPIEIEAIVESDGYVSLVAKREGEG
jgi:transcription elongation factor Elf1